MDANLTNKCGENEEIGTEKESIQIRKSKKIENKNIQRLDMQNMQTILGCEEATRCRENT